MIDLYYWPTPNGHKITIFLEEASLPYRIVPVNIGTGEQFGEEFLRISPNNKIPALVDDDPAGGGEALSIFESGAILQYLALKTGRFFPEAVNERFDVLQWLYWQVGHLGPMLGQNHHFSRYAPEKIDYAIDRYRRESERLYGILDEQLEGRDFITGEYSIADMACYPWILPEQQDMDIEAFPNVESWRANIGKRPAVERAYEKGRAVSDSQTVSESSREVLFGQGRRIHKKA